MQVIQETRVHPLAVLDPSVRLGAGVTIGPYAVLGAGVEVGDGTEIGAGAQIQGPAKIGRDNRIYPMAALGFDPQDLKYAGEEVSLEVGDRNQFREFSTVHRGTRKGGGVTRIGSDNLFMAYSHVAHDCQVGSRTVFANNATLAGHVEVHDDASISAFSSVHQFCRVGRHAYVGGYTVVVMDALPFAKTVGQKALCYGLNTIGLQRKGVAPESIERLGQALRLLVRSRLPAAEALERIRGLSAEAGGDPDLDYLVAFLDSSTRGVHKAPPGRAGGRAGSQAGNQAGDSAPELA
jgi:UDP-N-acetylglucosamine acyltransferase